MTRELSNLAPLVSILAFPSPKASMGNLNLLWNGADRGRDGQAPARNAESNGADARYTRHPGSHIGVIISIWSTILLYNPSTCLVLGRQIDTLCLGISAELSLSF